MQEEATDALSECAPLDAERPWTGLEATPVGRRVLLRFGSAGADRCAG